VVEEIDLEKCNFRNFRSLINLVTVVCSLKQYVSIAL